MKSVAMAIISGVAAYFLLGVFVRDIRFIYWRQTPKKLGAISYLGVAIFLWVPVIVFSGLIEVRHPSAWYCLALLGLLISFIGYIIDSV